MRAAIAILLVAVASPKAAGPAAADPRLERFQLDNGLTVLVRPVNGSEQAAILVLYRIGGDHDPRGRSGLAHLIEHLYITAAAGTTEARTAEEFMQRYRKGWEAHTSDRFTIIATVFAARDLDSELRDAAARMGDLSITRADLKREVPRIETELANMFERIPSLAAFNQARELLRPTPKDGRRGGMIAHVKTTSLAEVRGRWQQYYKPRNALLAVTGGVKTVAVRKAVMAHFGKLPRGEPMAAASEPNEPRLGEVRALTVKPPFARAQSQICLAYKVPPPGSDLYAPYLVLVTRLVRKAEEAKAKSGLEVHFVPLMDPSVISIQLPADGKESAQAAVARAQRLVADILEPKLAPREIATVREYFGFFLGLTDVPESRFLNVYGLALRVAACEELGIDSLALRKALARVTDQDLRRAARMIFAPGNHGAALVRIKK
jgi:zinc protease